MIKHQEQVFVEENLSNLTSNEASVSSSSIRGETSNSNNVYLQQQQYFSHQQQDQNSQQQSELPPAKKKRNMPGNPDPDSEVIALSPKTLLAKNRFVCEICSKGFQRDQNLQLHRRGHNLPWKLKQRSKTEVIRRKVYVCPEESCVHHDPLRALGDLTGIKKHFCRKHSEKKWKCEKCSKKYAVQSDWKAHSKVCGTREYRCDCGTLFSRRDSFITHRAFCDALAEETGRAIPIPTHALLTNTVSAVPSNPNFINMHHHQQLMNTHDNNPLHNTFSLKREQNQNYMNLPPWLSCPPIENPSQQQHHHLTSSSSSSLMFHNQDQQQQVQFQQGSSISRNPSMGPTYSTTPHLSATALLQQAAQMGALQNQSNVSDNTPTSTAGLFGLHLSSSTTNPTDGPGPGPNPSPNMNTNPGSSYYHEMMVNTMSTSCDDAFGIGEKDISSLAIQQTLGGSGGGGSGGSGGKGNDGMTRDFLGLRPLSQNEILTMAGLNNCITNNNNSKPRNNLGSNHNNNNNNNNSQQEQETPHKSWQT